MDNYSPLEGFLGSQLDTGWKLGSVIADRRPRTSVQIRGGAVEMMHGPAASALVSGFRMQDFTARQSRPCILEKGGSSRRTIIYGLMNLGTYCYLESSNTLPTLYLHSSCRFLDVSKIRE